MCLSGDCRNVSEETGSQGSQERKEERQKVIYNIHCTIRFNATVYIRMDFFNNAICCILQNKCS